MKTEDRSVSLFLALIAGLIIVAILILVITLVRGYVLIGILTAVIVVLTALPGLRRVFRKGPAKSNSLSGRIVGQGLRRLTPSGRGKALYFLSPSQAKPPQAKPPEGKEQRRVDLALERRADPSATDKEGSSGENLQLGRKTVLEAGADYLLRVRIGEPFKQSLLAKAPPSIDDMLPRGLGYQLDVVVFSVDFEVLEPPSKHLNLPESGPSSSVAFRLRARKSPRRATLRLGIYHRNHLLQSFILHAQVAAKERVAESEALSVVLEFSRTNGFTNLRDLRPRAISLGLNQAASGTHTLMIKRDGVAQAVSFEWQAAQEKLAAFRQAIGAASSDRYGNPRFPVGVPVDSAGRETFQGTIRQLAVIGKDLYDGLWVRTPELESTFRTVAQSSDETIQVVRFDPNNVLPWSVIYDYPLPELVVGEAQPPICLGWGAGVVGQGKPAKSCTHGPGQPGYCIYGFWGIRHSIEELLPGGRTHGEDPCLRITRESPDRSVWISVDVDEPASRGLKQSLEQLVGADVLRVLTADDDLLPLLWQPQERPKILIVLGHLETKDAIGEPSAPRIVLPGHSWLRAGRVTQQTQDAGRWREEPHVLTLLMACGSATTEPTTLNDLVIAFTDAGSSAVLGTEGVTFSGLAGYFVEEVATMMWKPRGASLGNAVKEVRRGLATAENPLGFIFSSFGSADLTVAS